MLLLAGEHADTAVAGLVQGGAGVIGDVQVDVDGGDVAVLTDKFGQEIGVAGTSPSWGRAASRTSTSPSVMDTSRVCPSPSRTVRTAARCLPVGLSVGRGHQQRLAVPVEGQRHRYGAPSAEALTRDHGGAILANPRYTGRQVWNRQRTDRDRVDPQGELIRCPRPIKKTDGVARSYPLARVGVLRDLRPAHCRR
jgi:hypothetical protein